jgi:hypothetical protein
VATKSSTSVKDGDVREILPDQPGGIEAFCCVRGRHPDIDDHQLWLGIAHDLPQLVSIADLADYLELEPLQQAGQALAQ